MNRLLTTALVLSLLCVVAGAQTAPKPVNDPVEMEKHRKDRAAWGAPVVKVSQNGDTWLIEGQKQKVTLNAKDLSMTVQSGPTIWAMVPSGPKDMLVKVGDSSELIPVQLAGTGKIAVEPYDTGFKTGVKITASDWVIPDKHMAALDLKLYMTVGLEGKDEELSFDVTAKEGKTRIDRLDWPPALDAREIDHTILSNIRGVLLPRNWPKVYNPIRAQNADGSYRHAKETSEPQSNVIEDWSMSWWGFQKGRSAMMVIIETPDDAAYQFDHPAGGPTVIGPRWRESLGRLAYMRSGRMLFFPEGNYVTLAKRYRKYAMDTGLFVSLNEKILRRPIVKELIGTPFTRMSILRNVKEDSLMWSTTQPERNFRVTSFEERAAELKRLKEAGLERYMVVLTSWPKEGYDRQHPDVLPPALRAGGWEGMKRLADTCKELGYLFTLHDQYRDYYTDAPSYNVQFAVQEPADYPFSRQFPGSRFGQWTKNGVAYMNNWDGGEMNYLNPRYMLGHNIKNYQGMFDHGIRPVGSYQDVFGYVPPDQDFNPEHPTTRTDGRLAREAVMKWCANNVGIVGTEAGCDFTVPFSDYCTPPAGEKAIVVPLFNLVYHDAIMSPAGPGDLRGLLNGCFPQIGGRQQTVAGPSPELKRMMNLHKRVALLEMTNHEFLDGEARRKERTTFSDGTTVTVDWDARSVEVKPELN